LSRNQSAEHVEPVGSRSGSDDQRRQLIAQRVGDTNERVDVIDRILREAAVGREAIGTMSFVELAVVAPVIQARRVHALPAPLTSAAARMDFHGNPLADRIFVDRRPDRDDRAHVLVPGGEALVEWQVAFERRRRTMTDDFEIGGADGAGIDADQDLRASGARHGLLRKRELARVAKDPGLHGCRNWNRHPCDVNFQVSSFNL
jgi:hypothetical protein